MNQRGDARSNSTVAMAMTMMDQVSTLDRQTATFLTRRYVVGLTIIAALAISSQLVVQHALARQQPDSQVVNLAGRQRMLSQRLCKAVLVADTATAAERIASARTECDETLAAWIGAHERLVRSNEPGMGQNNSATVAMMLAAVDQRLTVMAAAAREQRSSELLSQETGFVEQMDAIVAQYGREAAERVNWLSRLEYALLTLALAVLAIEAVVVFAPAVRRIRQAIAERERLREHEIELEASRAATQTASAIASDLHDGLGQQLTGLAFQATALARQLSNGPAQRAALELAVNAEQAIRQTRSLARRLSPLELARGGLPDALRQLCADTAEACAVACTVSIPERLTLADHDAEIHVFRIVQEAITNALRHGRAKRITVRLSRDGSLLRLLIRDEGRGMAEGANDGFGLRSMRLRARRLGGTFAIQGFPGQGTEINITWSHLIA